MSEDLRLGLLLGLLGLGWILLLLFPLFFEREDLRLGYDPEAAVRLGLKPTADDDAGRRRIADSSASAKRKVRNAISPCD